MKRSIRSVSIILSLVLAVVFFFASCAPQQATPGEQPIPSVSAPVVTKEPTQSAEPSAEPSTEPKAEQRIVCLAPSMVEVVYALGLGDSIVGWSRYTDYPPDVEKRKGWVPYGDYEFVSVEDELAKDVAVVSGFTDYNADVIAALNPTIILAESDIQKQMADELSASGYKVLFNNPKTLDEVFEMILNIGEALGVSETAENLVNGYKADIEEIKAITKDLPKVKVYIEIAHVREYDGIPYGPYATGSGTPFDQMIEIAGGVNVFANLQGDYAEVTYQAIVDTNPDVILSPMWPDAQEGEVTTIAEIVSREGFDQINAVKNSRVYFYDSSLFKRFGPRSVTAIKKLAYLLHPYYFDNPENSVSPWELGRIDQTYPMPHSMY